jgi:hypothetical protein
MKQVVAALLILGLTVTGSAALGAKPATTSEKPAREPRTSDSDVHRLLKLEDDWAAGLVKRDGALFRRLLAKGFIYTEDDRTMGRDELLRELMRGTDRVTAAHNERMRVHPFGSTAVVTGWLVVSGQGSKGTFDRRYRFTDTWVLRDGEWRLVAAHDYVLPHGAR